MRKNVYRSTAGLVGLALALAACGNNAADGGEDTEATSGDVEPLTIHASSANTWQANFNPYSGAALSGTNGFIYEPLQVVTPMQPGESIPWLAEEMHFDEDGTTVTFLLRDGVEWADGAPFTAEDVVFTFEMFVEHPATNLAALPVTGATEIDERTVEVDFEEMVFARQGDIGNTVIVPKHIWSEVENPFEFANDEAPVGTGPFELGQFSEQLYTLERHEGYWDAEEIHVEEIRYPSSTEQTFTTSLREGDYDWAGGFVANIEEIFVSQDPEHRGYWYAGGGTLNLTLNNELEIFDDPALREAISLGVDRIEVAEVGMQGYVPPSHPTALPRPTYESVLAEDYVGLEFTHDPDEANRILDEAGYEMGSDGVRTTPEGEPLSWELFINSGYPDWVDISSVIEPQLAEIGIELTPQGVGRDLYMEARGHADYDITLTSVGAGLSPYDLYYDLLSSDHLPEAGEDEPASGNFGRFRSDEADSALETFRSTDDDAVQQEALEELQRITVEEYPVIPLLQTANWFNYNTERWTGFPSDDDPYALGAPFQTPDNLLIVRNLVPSE